jgi:hypothetical protein
MGIGQPGETAMQKKSHAFLHALKLWLIWNALADISLVIFVVIIYVTFAAGFAISMNEDSPIAIDATILLLGFVCAPLMIGLLQRIAFNHRITNSYWWIFATALGWGILAVLIFLVFIDSNSRWMDFLVGALIGALIGLLQWLVLRGRVSGAGWWVLGSILGWACSLWAVNFLYWQTGLGDAGIIVGLLLMGMITGVAYAYLFSQPSQPPPCLIPGRKLGNLLDQL